MRRRPNILWIVTTQWRAAACGYAGDTNARTPSLDALVAESANFALAVTPHPFGPFARAALLTGVPCPANGVRDYFDPLPVDARTVAHDLRERGYRTAFFGKWHLAERDPNAPLVGEAHAKTLVPPERRGGFELWEGFESGFLLNDPWLHGSRLPEPVRLSGYQSDILCDRASAWWHAAAPSELQPVFCVISLEPPHPPYAAPAGGVGAYEPSALELPANVPRGGEIETTARRELAGYYAHIEATDRAIGRLLGTPVRDDTIVVVTSVHGDMHGAHGLFRKGWPYEESIRVPLLVRFPDAHPAAQFHGRRDELVSLLDLAPWARTWAENTPFALATGGAQRISMPSVVALPKQCDRPWRGVRTRTRKLVMADPASSASSARLEPWLYFDLERDPLEQKNLADDPTRQAEIAELVAFGDLARES